MAGFLYTNGVFQGIDNDGNVVALGTLKFTYTATGLDAVTYQDSDLTITNTNPINLTASGKAEVYLKNGTYDVVLKDSLGVVVWSETDFIYNLETVTEDVTKNIDTIADLRLETETPNTVWLTGYHTKNDGAFGSNIFEWDDTSTEADNDGTIIKLFGTTIGRYKLKTSDNVNIKWFGAKGDGATIDDTARDNAIKVAKELKGMVYCPRGTYLFDTTYTVDKIANGGDFDPEDTIIFIGDGATATKFKWNKLTGIMLDWKSGIYGGFHNIGFESIAEEGHTGQVIDGFTTTTTALAGCTATSSIAIRHAYNGSFIISGCDFQRFHTALSMELGYNRAIKDSSIMFCNVGIGTYGAATINFYRNLRVERCAIGLSFVQSSTITMESVVSQANYAGCDVNIQTVTHSLHFNRCYFEASPVQVFIQGGGDGNTIATPTGHVFTECNSIKITSQGRINDIHMIRCLCLATPIEHAGIDKATYFVKDNYQQISGNRVPAVGYDMGTSGILWEQGGSLNNFPDSVGVGTDNPNGVIGDRYLGIESNFPGIIFRSVATGGLNYSIVQDILAGNGWLTFSNESNDTLDLVIDNTATIKPGTDNSQSLGSASSRWSEVFAGTGTINTSDDREKTYREITEVERLVAIELKGLIKSFRFNDAIESKGVDKARIHYGASAQTIKATFEKYGLTTEDYALFCYDEWEEVANEKGEIIVEAGNRYGIRYEELLCFIVSAI